MRTFVFGRTIRTSSSKEEANECMVSTCAYAWAMRPRAGDACDTRLTEHAVRFCVFTLLLKKTAGWAASRPGGRAAHHGGMFY
jgi:hypothetical protein